MEELLLCAKTEYARADAAVSEMSNGTLSRSAARRLIDEGKVLLDGQTIKASRPLHAGQVLQVYLPDPEPLTNVVAEDIPIDVVYEDKNVIVINKPRGMTVHPAAGNTKGTLVNALLFHCTDLSGINGTVRPGIVHRIDKDTTGLLIVAKNDTAHRSLAAQIQKKTCAREYLAIVEGNIKEDSGVIDAPIGRNPRDRKQMAVVEGGRNAVTYFDVLERFGTATLVHCRLATGRTHQIRVHMKHIGHPLLGDPVYGSRKQMKLGLSGQALHAFRLTFDDPKDGHSVTVTAPPDPEMEHALYLLRARSGKTV